jgi:hypothetical protein
MASGTILGTTSNQYIDAKIEWSSTPYKSVNQSDVTIELYYKRNNEGYTTHGIGSFWVGYEDNGNMPSSHHTRSLNITENGWVRAAECTFRVDHDSDGSKSILITGGGSIPNTSLTSSSVRGMVNLDTIPRESAIPNVANTVLGTDCVIKWTPFESSFHYKLKFALGEWNHITGVISPGRASEYTYNYTLPLDIANQLPNAKTGKMTVTLYTYYDAGAYALVGSEKSTEFIVTVPENDKTKPTISMNVSPSSNLPSPFNSIYLQGHSKVKAELGFDTKYGATVAASNITVCGDVYDSPYESAILTQTGTISVKATVKDSRGFYGTHYKEIEVIPYAKPYVRSKSGETSIIAARCDASANFTDSGTYLKIKAKIVYSKVIAGGVQKNYGVIKFRYRKEGGAYSAWQTILDCKTNNSDEVITPPLLNGALDIKANYQVQIVASDDLYETDPVTMSVPSDVVYMDRPAGGKSMGLGGYSSGDGNLDIHWKTRIRGGLSLFDSKGDEIPLDSTLPIPRDQIKGTWDPNSLECGVHVVANNNALKQGDTVIMYNGVLIQMNGDVGGNVKIQLAYPVDENRNPMYRLCWYSNWSDWRAMKL